MKFVLSIDCDNAVFEDAWNLETSRILRSVANQLEFNFDIDHSEVRILNS